MIKTVKELVIRRFSVKEYRQIFLFNTVYKNEILILILLGIRYKDIAKELIDNSGMPILSATLFQKAADQVQKALS